MLNGYRIGEYPATPLKGNPLYLPPPGFIEVTKDNQDTKVSPHFTLKQFLCKEDTTQDVSEVRAVQGAAAAEARGGARARQRAGIRRRHPARDERVPHAVLQPRDRRREVQHAPVGQRRRHLRRSAEERSDGRSEPRRPASTFRTRSISTTRSSAARRRRSWRAFRAAWASIPATSAHPPFVHVDVRGTAARWKGMRKVEVRSTKYESTMLSLLALLLCVPQPARAPTRCWRTKPTSTRCGRPACGRCWRAAFRAPRAKS